MSEDVSEGVRADGEQQHSLDGALVVDGRPVLGHVVEGDDALRAARGAERQPGHAQRCAPLQWQLYI